MNGALWITRSQGLGGIVDRFDSSQGLDLPTRLDILTHSEIVGELHMLEEKPGMYLSAQCVRGLGIAVIMTTIALAAIPSVSGQVPGTKSTDPVWKRLQAPADPGRTKGTWTLGDRKISITDGDFHKLHVLMTKLKGSAQRAVSPREVWTHILLASEAEAYGLVIGKEAVDDVLEADDEDIYQGVLARWRQAEVSTEDGRRVTRERIAIGRLKDLFLNTQRVSSQRAFDRFKRDRLRYKLAYVEFDATKLEDHDAVAALTDEQVQKYWTDNVMMQNRFRKHASISAQIVFLDRAALSEADAVALSKGRKVTRRDALDYFAANRTELMAKFPADKRHLIQIDDDTKFEDIVSPFSVLEESIRKRLLVENVINAAHAEAIAGGSEIDIKSLAERYKLGFTRVEDLKQTLAAQHLRRFGFNAWNQMKGVAAGQVSPRILSERDISWFFFVSDSKPSRLPEFASIKDEIRKAYAEQSAYSMARDRARKAKTDLDKMVEDEVKAQRLEIEARFAKEAEREIEDRGLTISREMQRVRGGARSKARREVELLRRSIRPRVFDRWLQEGGHTLTESDYFAFEARRRNRAEVEDEKVKRLLFFQTNFYIRNLQKGEVSSIVLDDPVMRTLYIARLIDKADPSFDTMKPTELLQAKQQEAALSQNRFLQRWQYQAAQVRLGLKVN